MRLSFLRTRHAVGTARLQVDRNLLPRSSLGQAAIALRRGLSFALENLLLPHPITFRMVRGDGDWSIEIRTAQKFSQADPRATKLSVRDNGDVRFETRAEISGLRLAGRTDVDSGYDAILRAEKSFIGGQMRVHRIEGVRESTSWSLFLAPKDCIRYGSIVPDDGEVSSAYLR